MRILTIYACLFLIHLAILSNVAAQGNWKAVKQEMQVKGTSTLHDWHMDVKDAQVNTIIRISNEKVEISQVKVRIEGKKILSENSMMDDKAHKALKVARFPVIEFVQLGEAALQIRESRFSGTLKGELSLAGVRKPIEILLSGQVKSGNTIVIYGSKALDMKDYKLDPPTAMLGTIKTGKDVIVEFTTELLYQ